MNRRSLVTMCALLVFLLFAFCSFAEGMKEEPQELEEIDLFGPPWPDAPLAIPWIPPGRCSACN